MIVRKTIIFINLTPNSIPFFITFDFLVSRDIGIFLLFNSKNLEEDEMASSCLMSSTVSALPMVLEGGPRRMSMPGFSLVN